jgi:hypothetical protein
LGRAESEDSSRQDENYRFTDAAALHVESPDCASLAPRRAHPLWIRMSWAMDLTMQCFLRTQKREGAELGRARRRIICHTRNDARPYQSRQVKRLADIARLD